MDEEGEIIIGLAAHQKQWNIICKVLTIDNIDVDGRNGYGRTALMNAAWCNEWDMVEALNRRKANVNAANNEQNTALHWASRNEANLEIIKKLVEGKIRLLLTLPITMEKRLLM